MGQGNGAKSGSLPTRLPLTAPLQRNIEVLRRRREEAKSRANAQERVARAITRFSGGMWFVYTHLALGLLDCGQPWLDSGRRAMGPDLRGARNDRFGRGDLPLDLILITQSRMAAAADRRAEQDLPVSLLAGAEITKLVELVSEIEVRMQVPAAPHEDVEEMKRQVHPEAVLDAIEEAETEV